MGLASTPAQRAERAAGSKGQAARPTFGMNFDRGGQNLPAQRGRAVFNSMEESATLRPLAVPGFFQGGQAGTYRCRGCLIDM